MAEQFCDVGRGITLCYEAFGEESAPPLLLVMGLGTQMLGWPDEFCRQLAERGFHVVRFDNRDAGRSTQVRGRPPSLWQLARRRIDPVLYTLSDMAEDAHGLLSELRLEPAHVVGASMGGMIAQTLAAEHPGSVRSLVSIMSNTGSRWSGNPSLAIYRFWMTRPPQDREGYIKRSTSVFAAIGSKGLPQDTELYREIAARSYDRGYDPAASGRQLGAIFGSGDRTKQLRSITAPTLVIHGSKDPMVSRSGGVATAKAIPGARMITIQGMGHDLPSAAWPQLLDAIAEHARAADRTPVTAQ
jgi:pimeloyl-ACP methyl ester carboxylesterase